MNTASIQLRLRRCGLMILLVVVGADCGQELFSTESRLLASTLQVTDPVEAAFDKAIANAANQLSNSVLRIELIGGDRDVDGKRQSSGVGTALVVDAEGWLLTSSFFVANRPAGIIVTLPNGTRVPAEIAGKDEPRKLTLLRIETEQPLAVPTFTPRKDLSVGQSVIALGRTLATETPQISLGILSATRRVFGRAIQTDAKISPSNFGGPLVNLKGEVLGILCPMSPRSEGVLSGLEWYDSGIGFAVPVDEVLVNLDALKKGEVLKAGKLGVSFRGTNPYTSPATIAFMRGQSPAADAGLRLGDTIVELNGLPITRLAQFKNAIGPIYAGQTIRVKYRRAGSNEKPSKPLEATATLIGQLPPYRPVAIGGGFRMDDKKVIVQSLEPGGMAETGGLQRGDIILAANGDPIDSLIGLQNRIVASNEGQQIELLIQRGEKQQSLKVEIASRNASVPKSLEPIDVGEAEAKWTEVKVAEDANRAFAIIPPTDQAKTDPSLLVWLQPEGSVEQKASMQRWQAISEDGNTVILLAESSDPKKWQPEDAEFVTRAVTALRRQVKMNPSRTAIAGQSASGRFASVIAFANPKQFQGLVLDGSALSRSAKAFESSPLIPFMVLTSNLAKPDRQRLREENIPVQVTSPLTPEIIVRWLQMVDRL